MFGNSFKTEQNITSKNIALFVVLRNKLHFILNSTVGELEWSRLDNGCSRSMEEVPALVGQLTNLSRV
jgi:hypothetical protein